jgi:hypothetical protein
MAEDDAARRLREQIAEQEKIDQQRKQQREQEIRDERERVRQERLDKLAAEAEKRNQAAIEEARRRGEK